MSSEPVIKSLGATAMTLLLAAIGAWLGRLLHLPAPVLTGPVLAVTLGGLAGLRLQVAPVVRDAAFLVVGVGLGAIVTSETTQAIGRWPLAFAVLAVALVTTMAVSQWVLRRGFGFDRRSAILASAPGHLSFVIGLGTSLDLDMVRVTIVQSLRLFTMSLVVPILALTLGVEVTLSAVAGPDPMPAWTCALLLLLALGAGVIGLRLNVPAALFIAALGVSGVAHGAGLVSGGVDAHLAGAGFIVLGALIGTRFSGVSWRSFVQALGAGAAVTLVASLVAAIAAQPVAAWLDMPPLAIVAAFAPGGFEMMIALGAVLGANPGLVAACHLIRLVILTGLVPYFLVRARPSQTA